MDIIERLKSEELEHELTVKQLINFHREAFEAYQKGDLERFSQAYKEIRIQYLEEAKFLKEEGEEKSTRLELLGRITESFWGICRVLHKTSEGKWVSSITNYEVFLTLRKVENSLLDGGWEQFVLAGEKRDIVKEAEQIIQIGGNQKENV